MVENRMAASIFVSGRVALISVLALFLAACSTHATMLYPIPDFPVPEPPSGFQEHRLGLSSGERVILWTGPDTIGGRWLLYLHGNAENLGTLLAGGFLSEITQFGRVSALDYPGYGRSTGKPSEAKNVEAAVLAIGELTAREPRRLVLVGWSLGAAVAVQAAVRSQDKLAGLVLLSPWHSLDSVARRHFPGWMVWLLRRESYDSGRSGRGLRLPVIIVHGESDGLIPLAEARALAKDIPGSQLVVLPGIGHNDLPGSRPATDAIAAFLARLTDKPK